MRKGKFAALVIGILVVVVLIVSGTVQFNVMNLLSWLGDMGQMLLSLINPQPRDIPILIIGAVIGLVAKIIFDKVRS